MPYKDPAQRLAQQRRWREAHRDEILLYAKAWHAAHPEVKQEYQQKYREKHAVQITIGRALYRETHREVLRAKSAVYTQSHKEQIRVKNAAHYLANKARMGRKRAAWEKNNPEKARAKAVRRRARKAAAPRNDLTGTQWLAIKAMYGHRCVYCSRTRLRLTMDHITPLSKGGAHTATNIVPACRSCNAKKGTKDPFIPVQPLLLVAT